MVDRIVEKVKYTHVEMRTAISIQSKYMAIHMKTLTYDKRINDCAYLYMFIVASECDLFLAITINCT